MGAIIPVELGTTSNPARYPQGGVASLLNCYVEKAGEEGKTPWPLYAADGLQGFATLSGASAGVRAMIVVAGVLYVVAGTSVYTVTAAGVVTSIGAIATTGPVYMRRNRRATNPDITIVSDGLMYNYRTSLNQVTDVDLLAPLSLAYLDGYMVTASTLGKWQIGAIDDASAFDALDVTRAESDPDEIVLVHEYGDTIVTFGEVSTEFWDNTGAADFPFERLDTKNYGCGAKNSVAMVGQTLFFIAHDRTVCRLAGYDAERVSNHAVERAIESISDRDTITATSWVKGGHQFYVITSSDWTWGYDTLTGTWHERKSHGRENWRISKVVDFDGRLIAGDADSGILYEMSDTFGDEAGEPLIVTVIPPAIHSFPNQLTFNAAYVDVESGVGSNADSTQTQDVTPEIALSWSDDGGVTFGAPRMLSLGQDGQRVKKVRTFRLGTCGEEGRVFKLSTSAKVSRALYGMRVDVDEQGA
jgi:hypothetical protein